MNKGLNFGKKKNIVFKEIPVKNIFEIYQIEKYSIFNPLKIKMTL